jgi:hypothetical protein
MYICNIYIYKYYIYVYVIFMYIKPQEEKIYNVGLNYLEKFLKI